MYFYNLPLISKKSKVQILNFGLEKRICMKNTEKNKKIWVEKIENILKMGGKVG